VIGRQPHRSEATARLSPGALGGDACLLGASPAPSITVIWAASPPRRPGSALLAWLVYASAAVALASAAIGFSHASGRIRGRDWAVFGALRGGSMLVDTPG